jgi:hypothetical protein
MEGYKEKVLKRSPNPAGHARVDIICQTLIKEEDLSTQRTISKGKYRTGDTYSNIEQQEYSDKGKENRKADHKAVGAD